MLISTDEKKHVIKISQTTTNTIFNDIMLKETRMPTITTFIQHCTEVKALTCTISEKNKEPVKAQNEPVSVCYISKYRNAQRIIGTYHKSQVEGASTG